MDLHPRRLVWNVVPTILVLGIIYLAVFGDNGMIRRFHMNADVERVGHRLEAVQAENARLERVVDQLRNDPVTARRAAAEELMLVPANSAVYRFSTP